MTGSATHTVALFRDAVRERPGSADAWYNLGKACADAGDLADAVDAYQHSAALAPADAMIFFNLGNVLQRSGHFAGARDAYREALRHDPANAAIHLNLGCTLEQTGDPGGAMESYRHALHCSPDLELALNNLAGLLTRTRSFTEAEHCARRAIEVNPEFADAWYNLAGALAGQDRAAEAEGAYRMALRIRPAFPEALVNLAGVMTGQGRDEEAITLLRQAIALRPAFAEAHFNLAVSLLLTGQWEEGWREYEWRTRRAGMSQLLPASGVPVWDGVVRPGETLLIVAEQGYGDTIQCARFLPPLAEAGMKLVLVCRPELFPLFEDRPEIGRLVAPHEPAPHADHRVALFSLPMLTGLTPATVPSRVPYLTARAIRTALWRPRMRSTPHTMHCVVITAGNPEHPNDRNRSLPDGLVPLLTTLPGITWHTLLGEGDIRTGVFPAFPSTLHHGGYIRDFGDTAAIMESVDLVISVDTAAAHLAGALGRPLWVLLPHDPDWRWMRERTDSVWYPTARLFRQTRPGDWQPVLAAMRLELERSIALRAAGEGGR